MKTHARWGAMTLLAVSLICSACGSGTPDSPLAGTAWALVSIEEGGETFLAPATADALHLVFTEEITQDAIRRRLSGSGGCNLLVGSYRTAPPDTLRLGALASTRKACPADVMAFEIRFTRVLTEVTSFAIVGSRLSAKFEDGVVEFEKGSFSP